VKKLDFVTTPGYLTGSGARERAGLPRETGPYRVITQLGIMGFDQESKKMKLISVHPGVKVDDVIENTGFELLIQEKVGTTKPPEDKELRLLREEIDPYGIVIGKN
jgi:glutaconate CoA-transferase subunit B